MPTSAIYIKEAIFIVEIAY